MTVGKTTLCGGEMGKRLDIRCILRTINDELFTMASCEVQILTRTIWDRCISRVVVAERLYAHKAVPFRNVAQLVRAC